MLLFHLHSVTLAFSFARVVLPSEICMNGKIPLCSDGSSPKCEDDLVIGASACPKACDPHNNRCDATTAPTCIYPDPRVNGARGACACRPGYKATEYASNDASKHWRLPVEGHEHRVWVAEDVKCDTLCDVSTGVNSCLEVPLLGKECVGTGTNASYHSVSVYDSGIGNYSRSLSTATTDTESETFDGLTMSTDIIVDDTDGFDDLGSETEMSDDAEEPDPAGASKTIAEEAEHSETFPDDLDFLGDDTAVDISDDIDDSDLGTEDAEAPTELDEAPDDLDKTTPAVDETTPSMEDLPMDPLNDAETEDMTERHVSTPPDSPSSPSLEARQVEDPSATRDHWAEVAQRKGEELWSRYYFARSISRRKALPVLSVSCGPRLCPYITRSVVDSCKRGVRVQVAYCKQAAREKIDQCKRDVSAKVDKCKKKNRWSPWICEPYRLEGTACEGKGRIDVPLCEVDRLTAGCCEGLREAAATMCSAGVSTAAIQKQVQSAQAKCSVVTGLAKVAMKSYLSGQALGVLTQLESVRAIGDTVQIIRKAEQTRGQFDKWASGLQAAAEGRLQDAEKLLGPLAAQIEPKINDAIAWKAAAEAVVQKNVDKLVAQATQAAGDLKAIKSATETIRTLKGVADDIKVIEAAAKKCSAMPQQLSPAKYPRWKSVDSEAKVEAAVAAYKKRLAVASQTATECQTVARRAQRLLR